MAGTKVPENFHDAGLQRHSGFRDLKSPAHSNLVQHKNRPVGPGSRDRPYGLVALCHRHELHQNMPVRATMHGILQVHPSQDVIIRIHPQECRCNARQCCTASLQLWKPPVRDPFLSPRLCLKVSGNVHLQRRSHGLFEQPGLDESRAMDVRRPGRSRRHRRGPSWQY